MSHSGKLFNLSEHHLALHLTKLRICVNVYECISPASSGEERTGRSPVLWVPRQSRNSMWVIWQKQMMWVFFTALLEAEFAFFESRSTHRASHSFFFFSVQSGRRGHILVHYSKGLSQRCHLWKSGYFIYISDVFRLVSDQVMACHRVSFVLSMKETTLGSWLWSTTLPAPPPLSCERTIVTSCELTKRTSTGFWGWVSLCRL